MARRILERGDTETLAQRPSPRIRLPDRGALFVRRALRLRQLSMGASIGDYLRFLAMMVDAQHVAITALSAAALSAAASSAAAPSAADIKTSFGRRMAPLRPAAWPRSDAWFATLESLCAALAVHAESPAGVNQMISRIRRAPRDWLEGQADALLQSAGEAIDTAVAPVVMASLQVHWTAVAASLSEEAVGALDVTALCPLCGSQPVASVVYAESPLQGHRYLHCALCAAEWHVPRVQCTRCGASGESISYQPAAADPEAYGGGTADYVVCAEICGACHGYRKILYQDREPAVDPVADDLATLKLDAVLGESGYHRASGNPLLWQPHEE